MVNEVAVTLVESCGKESVAMRDMGKLLGEISGKSGKIQRAPARSLIAHQKLDLLCYACYI